MLTDPTDARLYVVQPSDLRLDPLPAKVAENLEPLSRVLQWADDYLCRPHPELGRPGAVCPFTRPALKKDLLFLAVYRGAELDQDEVVEVVRRYRDWFLQMEPAEYPAAQYKFIGIIFPDIPESGYLDLIEATQARLKAEYVALGVMIGEFHPGPPRQPGLWNPNFRPLKSPLPMLGTRHMVPTDFPFLKDTEEHVAGYLERFRDTLPLRMYAEIKEAAQRFGLEMPHTEAADDQALAPVVI
jgi:hypothetical protein